MENETVTDAVQENRLAKVVKGEVAKITLPVLLQEVFCSTSIVIDAA